MMSVSSLGYVVLRVSDMPRWEIFLGEILGMQISRRHTDGSLGWRMDDLEQRFVISQGPEDEIHTLGWEMSTEQDLLKMVDQIRSLGHKVNEQGAELAHARGVRRLFSCRDPYLHYNHELYVGARCFAPTHNFQSSVARNGFKAGSLGLGHVALTTPSYDASVRFFQDVLGLGASGYADVPIGPDQRVVATFLHGTGGRHHLLAVLPGCQPKPTRHLMVEYWSMDDVGLAYERCVARGISIERAFGVHEGDEMFSFYALTPSGYLMEVGYGGLTGSTWNPVTHLELSRWGHKKPYLPAA